MKFQNQNPNHIVLLALMVYLGVHKYIMYDMGLCRNFNV